MNRTVWYAGLLLIIVGVSFVILPSAAFSNISADRSVNVSVASDQTAFLALTGTGNTVNSEQPTTVARLKNNLAGEMTVTYDTSASSPVVLAGQSNQQTETVAAGESEALTARCNPQRGANGGSGVTTFDVQVEQAAAGNVTISDATLSVDLAYNCPPKAGGPPGRDVAFDDENRNGRYDPGETSYAKRDLLEFDNSSVDLVITSKAGTIEPWWDSIEMKANSVTVRGATVRADGGVEIESESGSVTLTNAGLESGWGALEVKGKSITAENSEIDSRSKIEFEAESGPIALTNSRISSEWGKIELKGRSIEADGGTVITTNDKIKLEAESGAISLNGAQVGSEHGSVELKGRAIEAPNADITTDGKIKLEAESGDIDLTSALVESTWGKIELKGRSITASEVAITTNGKIKLESESDDIDLTDATLSNRNSKITVKSASVLRADGATFDSNTDISLTSSGDMQLGSVTIRSNYGSATATLNQASATLTVDGAVIDNRDATLTYSPSGVTVTGSPSRGSVRAG